ncbi:MAG: multicopper oxidase domain-containing protein [Rhizobiales bacterium]|nr:multicopper oxidase domain-containing protein [Hyphomicrobiales bacterium]
MSTIRFPAIDRRAFLVGSASITAAASLPYHTSGAATPVREFTLVAAPGQVSLVGPPHPDTDVWCYGGRIPGPEIRVRQGERVRVLVENNLKEETTVHWHGVRVPNAMDGVPHLTQKPIAPGEPFVYEFDCPDAGTFWYHPHQRSYAQVGRGLYGPLIVEEPESIPVDRDVTWVLSDWRLLRDASISDDFGAMMDVSHNGRVGNTVTVNGRVLETFSVRVGERIRLRLINAANARIFGLEFEGHSPQVIAIDGHPVEPHTPPNGRIVLGSAMRVDLLLDMTGRPGQRFRVLDTFYRSLEYRLLDLNYTDELPLRELSEFQAIRLAGNPLPEPDMKGAQRHQVTLGGGMMGTMQMATMDGKQVDIRTLMHNGLIWAINGVAASGHVHEPLLTLHRDRSHVLELVNDTAWHHPMHLHGHSFRVISRNGQPTEHKEWQDTVLLAPRERAEIAFVADNPGDWMFHCHVLEHQLGGMMGVIRVA